MIKVCVICGELFESGVTNRVTCSRVCQNTRERQLRAGYGDGMVHYQTNIRDLKLYEVLEIMRRENITINEYLSNRDFYVSRYLLYKGE